MKFDLKVIAFSVLAGMLVWISDAFLDQLFFSGKSFLDLLIIDVPQNKLFIRILIILYFSLFGGVIAAYAYKQKKSTEELQDYEFKYKTVADKTNAWEFWKNTTGSYNYVSPAFERITGYLVDDLKQNPGLIKKIIHPDDLERVTNHLEEEVKNTMEIAEMEFKIVTQNKEVKKIKHTCQPVYDKNGKYKGTRGSNIEIPEQTIERPIDISEIKKTREDLKTSEELFKALFENAPDAFFTHDVKGTLINCNKAAEELTGYKREELIGKNFLRLKLLNINDAVKAARLLAENALGNPAGPEEFTINKKDGKKVPVEIRNFPINIDNRVLVFSVARCISERKQAEEEIEFLSRFPDENPEPVLRVDIEGIVYYANIASNILLKKWKTSVGDKLPASLIQSMTNIIAESGNYKFEETCDEKVFEIHCVPIENYGYINLYASDITKRKRMEEALRESERLSRTIFETAQDTIFIKDRNLRYTQVNPSMERLFDLPVEKLIGRTNEDLFGKETGVHVSEVDSRVLSGEIVKEENTRLVQGTPRTFHVIKVPIRNESGRITGLCGIARDITERKRAEDELIRKTYELGERVKELKCLYDITQQMVQAGNTVENIIQKIIQSIPPSWQYPEITCARITLNDGRAFSSPNWEETALLQSAEIVSGIGNLGLIDVGYLERKPEKDEGPFLKEERKLIDAIGILLGDFIEKKEAESALIESENKFRTLSYAAQDAIIMMDENGKITYWNKAAEKMFGFSENEIMGMNLHHAIVPGRYFEKFKQGFDHFQKSGEGNLIGKPVELSAVKKDGEEFPIELSLSAVNIKGKWNSIGIVRDITQRKLAEEELQRSEERFRGLYENSMLGIFRSSPEGKIIVANPAALSLLGYANLEEISNIKVEDGYCDPSERKRFKEIMDSEGAIQGFEIKWKRPDGTIVDLRESTRTITDRDGKVVYYEGTFEDITEKKRAEKALIKAKEKAEEMNLLKSNFLTNMSHELRTPLVGIIGFANMLMEELTNEENKQMAESILQSGERLSRTLDLILDLSMLESDKLKVSKDKINIIDAIEESIYSSRQAARKKGLEFNFESNSKEIYCNVDKNLFGRVIHYFLDNSIKFTYKGSINVKVFSNGNATIQIIDTGIGIPKDKLNIIFLPFRQASEGYGRKYEGTGLGLALAKKFIDVLGGTVKVESEEGRGTIFTIEFPEVR